VLLHRRPGLQVHWRYDPGEGCYVIEHRQDVGPVLEQNRRDQADAGGLPKGDFWHAGRIPLSLAYQWLQEGIDVFDRAHWPAVRRRLNDIDYAALRTAGRFRV
jgi:hypothetical protein